MADRIADHAIHTGSPGDAVRAIQIHHVAERHLARRRRIFDRRVDKSSSFAQRKDAHRKRHIAHWHRDRVPPATRNRKHAPRFPKRFALRRDLDRVRPHAR